MLRNAFTRSLYPSLGELLVAFCVLFSLCKRATVANAIQLRAKKAA